MKTKFIALVFVVASATAFAQGKINLVNDSLHLVYWDPVGFNLKSGDGGLAGQLVSSSPTPSGASLLVDLYGGLSAGSMVLQTTTTMNLSSPGIFGPGGLFSPNVPGGVTGTFQIRIRESSFATAEAAQLGGGYSGFSSIFTFNPSSTIAFNTPVNHGGTALSTWADGPYNLGVSGLGSISVTWFIPEPSFLSIFTLGLITCCISRSKSRQD